MTGNTTFFVSSKLLWEVVQPAHLLTWLSAVGTVLLWWHFPETGRLIITVVGLTVLVLGVFPVWQWAYTLLENRFANVRLPDDADGIIALGGQLTSEQSLRDPEESMGTTRLRKVLTLMQRYPNAQVYFSGFSPAIIPRGPAEYELAQKFFEQQGADLSRIHYEKRARNTYENGVYTQALAQPKPGQTWLLVTSAFHMPRSVGVFREIGWDVIAAQTGYMTEGVYRFMPGWLSFRRVSRFNGASREWVGLIAYYVTGKASALFPSP